MVVVKHSYIGRRGSGGRAIGKALAHLKYIQHRPGMDREKGGREIFSDTEDRVDGRQLRKEIREMGNQRVAIHKLMLAPEINPEDKKAFTREVMSELGRAKGHDLRWYAVEHNNTDHHHIHVVVMGKDRHGTDVRIDLKDIEKVKEYADRYLEREHPRELARSREDRQRQKEDRRRQWEKGRQERISEGRELPWMHKNIIREQLEPYEKWREKQDEKQREKDRRREERERKERQDTIKAVDKEYSKASSLEELRGLNERLWDNFDERLPKDEYKKLCGWIKAKERDLEQKQLDEKLADRRQEKKERDYFEHDGERYSKKDPYKKLTELARDLREKDERLPFEDYQKLRGWIEDRDRNRWQGALEKGLAEAKREMATPERPRTTETAGGRMIDPMQEHMMRNPVVGLFMVQAGLAAELVRSIELTENRDRLKEGREDLEKAKGDLDSRDTDDRTREQRDQVDKSLDETKQAEKTREQQQKEQKQQRERDDRDRDWFERGGGWER